MSLLKESETLNNIPAMWSTLSKDEQNNCNDNTHAMKES